MRIVALLRVSTEQQENHGTSLEGQERRFRELAALQRWEIVEIFRGQESAAKAAREREVFQRVTECLRRERPDALWVIEQSRLTRADELEAAYLIRELKELGVAVVVDTHVRDLANVDQRMVFRIQSAVDEAELARIRERLIRGRRERARQGRKTGGRSPYGYFNPIPGDPRRGVLQVKEDEAQVVRRIFRDVAAGVPLRALALQLTAEGIPAPLGGSWARSTIRHLLDSPVYTGCQIFGVWRVEKNGTRRLDLSHPDGIVVPGAHEALVRPELRDAALAQLRGTSNGRPGLLTGLLWVNGARAWIDGGHGRSFYCPADGGRGAWLAVRELDALLWEAFGSLFREPETVRTLFRTAKRAELERGVAGELEAIDRRSAKLEARLERLVEMRADGEISKAIYAERSEATRRALRETELARAAVAQRLEAAGAGYFERAFDALRFLLSSTALSAEQRRRALRQLLESIHVEASEHRDAQARGAGGRFGAAAGPRWRVRDVFFRLRTPAQSDSPGLSDRDRSGSQRGAGSSGSGDGRRAQSWAQRDAGGTGSGDGLLVQVVVDGEIARQPELVPARLAVGERLP